MPESKEKIGVLLINLGTPEKPEPSEVATYLKEFLMDPWVLDIPFLVRWILVHWIIVPRRSRASASQYQKVWTERGSPLLFNTIDLAEGVRRKLGDPVVVEVGMRYGQPSIESAILKLCNEKVDRLIAFPLYPQYSLAATESSVRETKRVWEKVGKGRELTFVPPFYDRNVFIRAFADVARPIHQYERFDHILFSFHGLPEKQIKKTDATRGHCLVMDSCCEEVRRENQNCYRAQCFATARAIAKALGIAPEKYDVSFQSRLKGSPWIRPFTDRFYRELPAKGIKRLLVFCPSFVADCLETLEEVCIRGGEEFRRHGGETITLVPSLNAHPSWVEAVSEMIYQPST